MFLSPKIVFVTILAATVTASRNRFPLFLKKSTGEKNKIQKKTVFVTLRENGSVQWSE
jgi:biopolymer transport protein ExbD